MLHIKYNIYIDKIHTLIRPSRSFSVQKIKKILVTHWRYLKCLTGLFREYLQIISLHLTPRVATHTLFTLLSDTRQAEKGCKYKEHVREKKAYSKSGTSHLFTIIIKRS